MQVIRNRALYAEVFPNDVAPLASRSDRRPNRGDRPLRQRLSQTAIHGADLDYRPDIDGLRAVAIAAVVLGHANVPGFSGGFVGVDVFFVISGFLITRLLLAAHATGRWSLLDFYDRRVRRLIPALAMVLMVSAVAAIALLLPRELRHFGGMLASAAAFAANIYAWQSMGYFGPEALDQPLLHTWSLGVEEQYYLLYPPLLGLVLWLGWRRALPWLLAVCLVVSLALSEALVRWPTTAAFYLLPPRGFELLAGGLLAMPGAPRPGPTAARITGVLGLLLIAAPVAFYAPGQGFPGLKAAAPVLGATLLIWSGGGQQGPATFLLSRRPLVGLGLISYSLYLWHWPILSFGALWFERSLTPVENGLGVALALLLAGLSWRFVERPFRRPDALGGRGRRFAAAAVVLAGLALVGAWLWRTDGLATQAPPSLRAVEEQARMATDVLPCRKGVVAAAPTLCGYPGQGAHAGTVIVWGDSHAQHFLPSVATVLTRRGYTVALASSRSCPPLLETSLAVLSESGPVGEACMAYNRRVPAMLQRIPDLKLVVLAGRWTAFASTPDRGADRWVAGPQGPVFGPKAVVLIGEGMERAAQSVVRRGVPVLLLDQTPSFARPPRRCVGRAIKLGRPLASCTLADKAAPNIRASLRAEMDELAAAERLISVYHPADVLCDGARCRAVEDGKLLFYDSHHLSIEGARLYARRLEEPLLTALVEPGS